MCNTLSVWDKPKDNKAESKKDRTNREWELMCISTKKNISWTLSLKQHKLN